MKKITNLVVIFALLLTGVVYGQQDPHYTQYMYNQNILNPAVAGSRADLSIALLGRTQWVSIEGAPDTQTLNISGKLGNNLGAAVSVIHDQIGPLEEKNIALDLSYAIPITNTGKLAVGVKGTYNMLDYLGNVSRIDDIDPALEDPIKSSYPNVGAGLYYYTDKFYLGFSVPNILQEDRISIANQAIPEISKKMHYFGTLGYVFRINDNLQFKPSTMVKFVAGSPVSIDLNGSFFINEMFEIGLSYREGDSIDALIGVQVAPTIRIGYAYDHTITNLADYNSGSHEIMLLFDLDFAKKHIKSPRFF
jgi:type IX secretion system PorP/SprF family membrane protein